MNTLDPRMLKESLKYLIVHYYTGVSKEKSLLLKQKEDTEDTLKVTSYNYVDQIMILNKIQSFLIVTVESHLENKKKIWKDKYLSLQANILTTSLYQIVDQDLTSKEKDLKPLSPKHSKEISKKLWLPTKTDCVVSVLNSSKASSKNTVMGKSWFSIKEKLPQKKNLLMTSFQLSQFSLPDSMDSEVTQSKNKSKNKQDTKLKTVKIRLFPNKEEKEQLNNILDQSRWYYNCLLNTLKEKYDNLDSFIKCKKKPFKNTEIRNLLQEYEYSEINIDNKIIKEMKLRKNKDTKIFKPEWWSEKEIHNRTPRGVAKKLSQNLNSVMTNYQNGNIKKFNFKYKSRKEPIQSALYEDENFPSFIKKIKSNYWYTNYDNKKVKTSFQSIFKNSKNRGFEIVYDSIKDKYFLHYPVEYNFYLEDDRRNESQISFFSSKKDNCISLDPGVRKFLVGYDPHGKMIFIGEKAREKLCKLLLEVDKNNDPLIWRKIKNMVNELHWKTISYLLKNYDTIILPEFRVSEMVNSKKLNKMTKRLMLIFSFFEFKQKLKWKCSLYNKKLIIVNESYTSKTCTNCFNIKNNLGSVEIYNCSLCKIKIDRDVCGSRNILIKNIK